MIDIDADWLRQKYEVEGLSLREVAVEAGVSTPTLRRVMVRHGIPKRTTGDGKRLHNAAHPRDIPTWTEKPCTACKVVKPLTDYHLNKLARDGRASWCKACAGDLASRLTRELRERVVATLGGVCVWENCGITDVRILVIDHKNGGGSKDRAQHGPNPYYRSILANLKDFQVLCCNHNHLKRILNDENGRGVKRVPKVRA